MFGDDDFKTMKIKDLPNFLDKHLCFKSDISELNMPSGTFLLDTEISIIKYLAHNGFLFSKKKVTHQYVGQDNDTVDLFCCECASTRAYW